MDGHDQDREARFPLQLSGPACGARSERAAQAEAGGAEAAALLPQGFKAACARHAAGVAIASVEAKDGAAGMTVSSFTSVSLDPPLVSFCIGRQSRFVPAFLGAGHFGVSVLGADQALLSRRYALPGERRIGTGEGEAFLTGAPLLHGRIAGFDCRLLEAVPAGDHLILLGMVLHADTARGKPLLYADREYCTLGGVC